uniref:Putative ovule protein n=1 Tax=Solanum chacoense TaxID=4108 RepID=A0A0V0IZN9_SOLCH
MTMSGCDTKPYPRIQLLPGGDWYNPMEKPHNFTVWLFDPKLHTMLRQHKCQTFSKSFSLQDSPSISFTTPTLHDFFKCNSTSRNAPNTTQKKNDHFAGYKIYNGCKDFSIYYKLSGDDDEDIRAGNLPANCSLIRLPIDTLAYDRDVFKMLSHVFLVQWELSYDCYQCHQGGGHCHTDKTNKFQCTDAQDAKTTKSKLGVTLGAVFGGVGLVMITLVVSFIWCYKEKKFSPSRFLTTKKFSDIFKHDVEGGSIYFGVPVFSYSELEEATNDFSSSRVLGDGGFGTFTMENLKMDGRLL